MILKELLYAYLAGVMDADGFFTIKRSSYRIRVTGDCKNPTYHERVGIKQVVDTIPKMIHELFGGYYNVQKSSSKKGKLLHSVILSNLKAHEFIKTIYPYLRIKRPQAKILLQLRESLNEGKRESFQCKQKSRWGKEILVTKYRLSKEQIDVREALRQKIFSLNDHRDHDVFKSKDW